MKKILPVFLVLMLLCGCGGNTNEVNMPDEDLTALSGGELRLFCDNPDTLNPIVTGYKSILDVMYLVYDGLYRVENDFSATPVLSSGYTTNADNTQYVVRLKKGVKFHDGTTFDAEDVIATVDNIKNSESVYNANLKNVVSYMAGDDNSVIFNLERSQANFVNLLDFPVLPEEETDYQVENKNFYPNGTGKFKVTAVNGDCVNLEINKDYHNGKSYVEKAKITFVENKDVVKYSFDAKEIDIVTTDLYAWGDTSMAGDFTTNEYESNRLTFLGFNCKMPVTSQSEVRRAFSTAVDKTNIVSEIMYSHGAAVDSPVNPNAYFANKTYVRPNFEPGKAREELKNKGWLDFDNDGVLDKYFGEDKMSLSFNLIVNAQNETSLKLANYLAENLISEGILINVVELDYEQYLLAISNGEFDLFIGRVDIANDCNLDFMLQSSETQNYFGYASSEMDGALYNISVASDNHSVKNAYKAFDEIFKNECPFVPFYFETDAVFSSSRIKGSLQISRTGVYTGLQKVFVNYEEK